MDVVDYQLFLNEVTEMAERLWRQRGGDSMGQHEMNALKETMRAFFDDKLKGAG